MFLHLPTAASVAAQLHGLNKQPRVSGPRRGGSMPYGGSRGDLTRNSIVGKYRAKIVEVVPGTKLLSRVGFAAAGHTNS
jgi:hypothetical protein